MSCNSQASLQHFEQVDPPHLPISPPRTSPDILNDERIKSLPILGAMSASITPVVYPVPPSVLNPSATEDVPPIVTIPNSPPPIPSTLTNLLPTVGEVAVMPVAHCTQPSEVEFHMKDRRQLNFVPSSTVVEDFLQEDRQLEVQPSTTAVEGVVQKERQVEVQPSTTLMEEAIQKEGQVEVQPSTTAVDEAIQKERRSVAHASSSAVDVIPVDSSNPEAARHVPQAMKRYLQRWPRGDKEMDPRFDNTTLHDFRTMHNNQDDDKRRASLVQAVPSHVHVSLLHP